MKQQEIIVGTEINHWTIISEEPKQKLYGRSFRMVKVKCECGKEKIKPLNHITSGHCKSCGCLSINLLIKRSTKHNLSYSRIHRIWKAMKERCNNPNNSHFKHYGGRGIIYDPRWENFQNFYADMNEGYADDLTIDRINNDGNYGKSNCRWATNSEQQLNKRRKVA